MANIAVVNEAVPGPSQSHDHYLMWRLTREMLNAGWVIVEASDGTTKTVGSGWTTLAESQNANSWCALARPGNTTWGHLFWFRNVSALWSGVTPSAFQYYTNVGWDTSASTASTPPVANGGVTYRISGNTAPNGARNWFGGQFSITNTHINIILKDDSANDDYSIVAWGMGSTNGSSSSESAFPCLFVWSAVDGPVDTTTGSGDPYVFFCHLENSEWPVGTPEPFGALIWRAVVNGVFENGTPAVLYRPATSAYLHNDSSFNDIYESPTTKYLEPFFIINSTGSRTYRGFAKWMRIQPVSSPGDFWNVANETGANNWVQLPSYGTIILPWDGSTTSMSPYGVGTVRPGSLMYAKEGGAPAPTLPTITMTAPVANPCDPRASITIDYEYVGIGGTAVCILTVIANGDTSGNALIYNGDPTTNTPAESAPSGFFEIVSQSDDGTTGQIVLRPIAGKYWPIDITTWTAIIETDASVVASSIDTQTVDATLIPPVDVANPTVSAQSPSPGSVINPNTAVSFTVTDDVALRAVFVFVAFAGTDAREVVHDGTSFTPNYAGASTRTGTSANWAYVVRRFGGWPASPEFTALAIDTSGNVPS